MKKNSSKKKKLSLRKETLLTLNKDALAQAAGATMHGGCCCSEVDCNTGTATCAPLNRH